MVGPTPRVIAAFDFDDTLITTDSLRDFLTQTFSRRKVAWNSLRFVPTFVRYGLGLCSNGEAKQRLLSLFLTGMTESEFERRGAAYQVRLNQLENPQAIKKLQWHQRQHHEVVIISASIEDWIRPWAQHHGITQVIATKLERQDGRLSGRLATPNCHGPEKVRRLLELYPHRKSYLLYMYGDGKSDADMFKLADQVFEKRF